VTVAFFLALADLVAVFLLTPERGDEGCAAAGALDD
jgi:hypothetical protein